MSMCLGVCVCVWQSVRVRECEGERAVTQTVMAFIASVHAIRDAVTHLAQVNTHVCSPTFKLVGRALGHMALVTCNTQMHAQIFTVKFSILTSLQKANPTFTCSQCAGSSFLWQSNTELLFNITSLLWWRFLWGEVSLTITEGVSSVKPSGLRALCFPVCFPRG